MSLCRPVLEYAASVWDPSDKDTIHNIEMIQCQAVRCIANFKVKRRCSVIEACKNLNLQTLEGRRLAHRISFLMKVLPNENQHNNLTLVYDEILNDRSNVTVTTRAAAHGIPTSIYASSKLFYDSFYPEPLET